jgi:hypothetical protein
MLKLIIADFRPELIAIWADVFSDIERVFLMNSDVPTLMGLPEIDAVLMRSIFAHERYGGIHKIGESQILSSQGEFGIPPWVVTTAPFAGHFEEGLQPDGTWGMNIVQNEKLTSEEEDYIVFNKAFVCIEKFNRGYEEPKIQTLGFHLWFLNFPRGEPIKEAEAVCRAYLELYAKRWIEPHL